MPARDWNLQPDGNVYLPQISGWRVEGMGLHIGIQLKTGPVPQTLLSDQSQRFQAALTPSQARKLARHLLVAADKMEDVAKGTG